MHHEVLLALLGHTGEFIVVDDGVFRVHPKVTFLSQAERRGVDRLVGLGAYYRALSSFVREVSDARDGIHGVGPAPGSGAQGVVPGLYLFALSDALQRVLDAYEAEVVRIEQEVIEDPALPVTHAYAQLRRYLQLFPALDALFYRVRMEGLAGGALVDVVEAATQSGVAFVQASMTCLAQSCRAVLLRQLECWCLHGVLMDPFGEFMVQRSDGADAKAESAAAAAAEWADLQAPLGFGHHATPEDEEAEWHSGFLMRLDALPLSLVTPSTAAKVLFIGKAVRALRRSTQNALPETSAAQLQDAAAPAPAPSPAPSPAQLPPGQRGAASLSRDLAAIAHARRLLSPPQDDAAAAAAAAFPGGSAGPASASGAQNAQSLLANSVQDIYRSVAQRLAGLVLLRGGLGAFVRGVRQLQLLGDGELWSQMLRESRALTSRAAEPRAVEELNRLLHRCLGAAGRENLAGVRLVVPPSGVRHFHGFFASASAPPPRFLASPAAASPAPFLRRQPLALAQVRLVGAAARAADPFEADAVPGLGLGPEPGAGAETALTLLPMDPQDTDSGASSAGAGGVWSREPLRVCDGFTSALRLRATRPAPSDGGGGGGWGFCFALQGDRAALLGDGSGGSGVELLEDLLAVHVRDAGGGVLRASVRVQRKGAGGVALCEGERSVRWAAAGGGLEALRLRAVVRYGLREGGAGRGPRRVLQLFLQQLREDVDGLALGDADAEICDAHSAPLLRDPLGDGAAPLLECEAALPGALRLDGGRAYCGVTCGSGRVPPRAERPAAAALATPHKVRGLGAQPRVELVAWGVEAARSLQALSSIPRGDVSDVGALRLRRLQPVPSEEAIEASEAWNGLEVRVPVGWPLVLVFSREARRAYERASAFLWRLKRTNWQLEGAWLTMLSARKEASKRLRRGEEATLPPLLDHLLRLRADMAYFVRALLYHVQVDVIEAEFKALEDAMRAADGFEALRKAHTKCWLNVQRRMYLNAPQINASMCRACECAQRFHLLLQSAEVDRSRAPAYDAVHGDALDINGQPIGGAAGRGGAQRTEETHVFEPGRVRRGAFLTIRREFEAECAYLFDLLDRADARETCLQLDYNGQLARKMMAHEDGS